MRVRAAFLTRSPLPLVLLASRRIGKQSLTTARIRTHAQRAVARGRVGNVAGLRRTLGIARTGRSTAVDDHEPAGRSVAARAHEGSGILKTRGRTLPGALEDIELIEILVNDIAGVKPQKTRIARDHALRVAARGHGCEIAQLEVLDYLGPDLNDIGNLLDREAEGTALLAQLVSKA